MDAPRHYRAGCQLIVFGTQPQTDLDGVFVDVAAAGFSGVETGNLFTSHGREEALRLLDRYGLVVSAMHSGFAETADEAKLEAALSFLHEVGARYLINSGVAERDELAAYDRAAEVFNRVGERCRAAGITFCYHNHDWEFAPIDGAVPFTRLAETTDPAAVAFNVDVYWLTYAGVDVDRFITTYGSRIPYVHLKDLKDGTFTELGSGTIAFPAILESLRQHAPAVEWLIYEQDRTTLSAAEAVAISGRYLRQLVGEGR